MPINENKNSLYQSIGGEEQLKVLVERFYDLMDKTPETEKIRALHPKSLKLSREKLFMFLSGVFGGPNLYWEKYGHPRLRKKHLPFPIGTEERDQWLWCMKEAVEESKFSSELSEELMIFFVDTANHMMNSENSPNACVFVSA